MRHRVITSHYGGWADPSECFVALSAGSEPLFWLDSGVEALTGMSCIGIGSRVVTQTQGVLHEWTAGEADEPSEAGDESILSFLRREQALGIQHDEEPLPGAFRPGWVGWLGYELHQRTLGTVSARRSRYADAAFLYAGRSIVFDHATHTVSLVALGESWSGELAAWKDETERLLRTLGNGGPSSAARMPQPKKANPERPETPVHSLQSANPVWAYSDNEYLGMIAECQRTIRAGDAYQLCLTTEVTIETHPDPVATYLRLREASSSHHGGFLRIGEVSLLSSSPEKFLTVSADGEVESKPIKGTRKRGATPREDAALRAELLASEKERAENLMIVDLVRNDLSRVCKTGSVTVPELLEVESYAQVHQLVSTVRGTLAAGNVAMDAVAACFPAGSMTGAPKLSAVNFLDGLERRARGIYSGAWGYFGLDGSVDLAMTIRSIVIDTDGVTIGTGGGITALSVPREELEETRIKVAALLGALGLVTL